MYTGRVLLPSFIVALGVIYEGVESPFGDV